MDWKERTLNIIGALLGIAMWLVAVYVLLHFIVKYS